MLTMPRRYQFSIRRQYLVLKAEGLELIETWFGTLKCVPSNLTKLYQLLLHLVTMNGTVSVDQALRLGYTRKSVSEALSRGFIELSLVPKRPSGEVLGYIREIIGKPPQQMFV